MAELIKILSSAARECCEQRNWYGALALALSLPDQCSFIETGERQSQRRYVNWFDSWVGDKYVLQVGADLAPVRVVFLSGEDMYALRCAFLHQGSGALDGQRAQRFLSSVQFVYPDRGPNEMMHKLREGNTVFLQVDCLVRDVCDGADSWLARHQFEVQTNDRTARLAVFRPVSSFPFRGENNAAIPAFRTRADAEEQGVYFPANWPFPADRA